MNLGYDESTEALNIRIQAHMKYSSLRIEDVLVEFLLNHRSNRILDVGCGSGNYSDLFAKRCLLYVGLDKNGELLQQAQQKCQKIGLGNTLFIRGDMNEDFPSLPKSFDLVFYGFSVYYTADAGSLVRRSKNILVDGGILYLVGPTAGNGIELDLVSRALFGVPSTDHKEVRLNRLEKEYLPIIDVEFGRCEVSERDFSLLFPTAADYTQYFLATPQYVELAKRFGDPNLETVEAVIAQTTKLKLTKKALFICAYNR